MFFLFFALAVICSVELFVQFGRGHYEEHSWTVVKVIFFKEKSKSEDAGRTNINHNS